MSHNMFVHSPHSTVCTLSGYCLEWLMFILHSLHISLFDWDLQADISCLHFFICILPRITSVFMHFNIPLIPIYFSFLPHLGIYKLVRLLCIYVTWLNTPAYLFHLLFLHYNVPLIPLYPSYIFRAFVFFFLLDSLATLCLQSSLSFYSSFNIICSFFSFNADMFSITPGISFPCTKLWPWMIAVLYEKSFPTVTLVHLSAAFIAPAMCTGSISPSPMRCFIRYNFFRNVWFPSLTWY